MQDKREIPAIVNEKISDLVHDFMNFNALKIRAGLVAYFPFQYPASVKPYRFRDTERRNCVLAYSQSNRPTNRK